MRKICLQPTMLAMLLTLIPGLARAEESGLDAMFGTLNGWLSTVIFFDVFPGEASMPFIVAWLIVGAVFLTVRFSFVNLRMMGHALAVLRGKYKTADDKGEVTSFQALTTALSATVGLGILRGLRLRFPSVAPAQRFG